MVLGFGKKKDKDATGAEAPVEVPPQTEDPVKQKLAAYRKAHVKADTTVPENLGTAAFDVNRHFEAAKINNVWYVRSKHSKGVWRRTQLQAAMVCMDLEEGKDVSSNRRQIAV